MNLTFAEYLTEVTTETGRELSRDQIQDVAFTYRTAGLLGLLQLPVYGGHILVDGHVLVRWVREYELQKPVSSVSGGT